MWDCAVGTGHLGQQVCWASLLENPGVTHTPSSLVSFEPQEDGEVVLLFAFYQEYANIYGKSLVGEPVGGASHHPKMFSCSLLCLMFPEHLFCARHSDRCQEQRRA